VDTVLKILRSDVAYVTVSQNACGVTGDQTRERPGFYQFDHAKLVPNLVVLSAGGYGHVPVPLLKQPEAVVGRKPVSERRYFASFLGSLKTAPEGLRLKMNTTLVEFAAARGLEVFVGRTRDWRTVMADSKFSLCPRGFGRSWTSGRKQLHV